MQKCKLVTYVLNSFVPLEKRNFNVYRVHARLNLHIGNVVNVFLENNYCKFF